MRVGIDIGGTLIKIAYLESGELHYRKFASIEIEEATKWVNEQFAEAHATVTGGKAEHLQQLLNMKASRITEFDATCKGIRYLLQQNGIELEGFVLANVGTGTSVHYVDAEKHSRIGGTGVGGGTIMGLADLLAGVEDYDRIVRLAQEGKRDTVDLKVKHIYEGSEPPISGDLTASNFGRVSEDRNAEDILAAVIGMVGETVATVSVFAAEKCETSSIVFIGSSFYENSPLQAVVKSYAAMKEANPLFVQNGEYSGALGALLSNQ